VDLCKILLTMKAVARASMFFNFDYRSLFPSCFTLSLSRAFSLIFRPLAYFTRFLQEHEIAFISRSVVQALDFMHAKGIAHHDVKAANR
jgi:serine/threonine protein kinase